MVPRIGRQGSSFKGGALYYLHDKGAMTAERVGFTHTENLPTDDPEMAWRFMAYTAKNAQAMKQQAGITAGRHSKKPVWSLSLSWAPEQQPEQEHMISAMRSALSAVGLSQHQALMVCHTDRDHLHIHAMVNLVHPETGYSATVPYSREKLSVWAERYERQHGKIYCQQRVEQSAAREPKTAGRDDLKAEITRAYFACDSGKAFKSVIEEMGFRLATDAEKNRPLLINKAGNVYSVARYVEGARMKDIRAKLADLGELPDIDTVRQQFEMADAKHGGADDAGEGESEGAAEAADMAEQHEESFDRDQQDREWQESIITAAIEQEEATGANLPNHRRQKRADAREKEAPAPLKPRLLDVMVDRLQRQREHAISELQTKIINARARKERELDKQYGEHERTLRKEIRQMEAKREGTGKVGRFFKKMTGAWQRDEQALAAKRMTLENIEGRQREVWEAFNSDSIRRMNDLKADYDRLRRDIETKPPAPESINPRRPRVQFDDGMHAARARSPRRYEPEGPSREL